MSVCLYSVHSVSVLLINKQKVENRLKYKKN